ncbi:hypothetical protein SAMN05446589_8399 [Streptomyces sp. OV198]|jgi:hypothetical protein|uniref:hypothetical protein n=1 Tax=Streptomyces sp. OV198 TaxID=1882787 RepID=UPI000BD834FF|nr:hypothetical protein [Streptomyces sp. OV198]SOE79216.1 hypothetical protein SAMN05446589_8399 [Streptomyces sp. OV198]
MNTPVDPYAVPDHLATRFLQVKRMMEALQAPNPPQFFVLLTRYVIEGEPYAATAVTVSAATPHLVQTQTGFACDATFPPHLLRPHARQGKLQRKGTVTVRLEVLLEDILQIVPSGPGG